MTILMLFMGSLLVLVLVTLMVMVMFVLFVKISWHYVGSDNIDVNDCECFRRRSTRTRRAATTTETLVFLALTSLQNLRWANSEHDNHHNHQHFRHLDQNDDQNSRHLDLDQNETMLLHRRRRSRFLRVLGSVARSGAPTTREARSGENKH